MTMDFGRRVFLAAIILSLTGAAQAARTEPLYLTGGTVISMVAGQRPFAATVLIDDGRINAISPVLHPPAQARVIDISGRYLLPGFIDMHAHVTFLPTGTLGSYDRATSEQVLKMMLAYGITTVRNPAAPAAEGVKLRDDVADGRIAGPRILTAGEPLNGKPLVTEAQIRAEVDRQANAGVDYIKVYANSTPLQTAAAIDEAHKRGLKVIGHLQETDWPTAAAEGIDAVTHGVSWSASALPPDKRDAYRAEQKRAGAMKARIFWLESVDVGGPEIGKVVASLKQHHVSDDPTLIVYKTKFVPAEEYRSQENLGLAPLTMRESWRGGGFTADWTPADYARMAKAWPKMLQLIYRYYREGVLLTTGTDLPNQFVVPGKSLHQEMELLVQAGIPAEEVLAMSTRNAATVLGLAGDIGTVEAGKRADLVVLRKNPLADIRNSSQIDLVVVKGRLLKPAALLGGR